MKAKAKKKKKDVVDIFNDTVETLELTVRSARRCAYDLKHCADSLTVRGGRDKEMAAIFSERAEFFVKLFQSGNSMKDYRHRLHNQIAELEAKVQTQRKLLAEHDLTDPTETW